MTMSTIVYHHHQQQQSNSYHHHHQTFEMTATINLKMPRGSNEYYYNEKSNDDVIKGGEWSFLQCLTDINNTKQRTDSNEVGGLAGSYVHPMTSRSNSARLSKRSLALCTEPLGSETGSDDYFEPASPIGSASANYFKSADNESYKSRKYSRNNNKHDNTIPPPLTTMSGANSIRVKPHREGGRLIISAIESPPIKSYLQAERSQGRLRLCFFTGDEEKCEEMEPENDEIEPENEEVVEEDEEDDDEEGSEMGRGIDGNNLKVGGKMGIKKKCLVGRCKESGHGGNKGLCHWGEPIKPLWVST